MTDRKRILIRSLVAWIPLALVTVLLAGTVYGAVQSDQRDGANDPQIQMATDARNALESGATPQSLVPTNQIDIAQSLAPYLVIYDDSGRVLASSATLAGQPIIPPAGVFTSARQQMDLVTFQPAQGVRSAIAVVRYANGYVNGYVLAGRSLTLVEQREDDTLGIVAVACLATLVLSFLAMLATQAIGARLLPSLS